MITIFGVFALFASLASTFAGPVAAVAIVSCVLGLALTLPALGVVNYELPAIVSAYLGRGHEDTFQIAQTVYRFPLVEFLPVLLLLPGHNPLGHRDSEVTGAADVGGILYAVSGLFPFLPMPIHTTRVIDGLFFLLEGGWAESRANGR